MTADSGGLIGSSVEVDRDQLSDSVAEAIRSGRKIDAIKQLREERGIGLKEAKRIVDRETTALRASNPNYALQDPSSLLPKILVIVAIGLAAYFFLKGSG